jgi:hypothetical protein
MGAERDVEVEHVLELRVCVGTAASGDEVLGGAQAAERCIRKVARPLEGFGGTYEVAGEPPASSVDPGGHIGDARDQERHLIPATELIGREDEVEDGIDGTLPCF